LTKQGRFEIATGTNNQIMSLNLSGLYGTGAIQIFTGGTLSGVKFGTVYSGFHTLQFNRDILDDDNNNQTRNELFGFIGADEAAPFIGSESLYTEGLKRGKLNFKHAVLDNATSPNLKVKDVLATLSEGGEIVEYSSAQKTDTKAEIVALVIEKPEPIPVAVYPKVGALNRKIYLLNTVTITFNVPVNTNKLLSRVLFAVHDKYGKVIPINTPRNYIDVINDKTIIIDLKSFFSDNNINTNYINLIVYPGVQSSAFAGSEVSTRPYLLTWTLTDFPQSGGTTVVSSGGGGGGGTGPTGPPA
jgi:hypothetical protein